MPTILPVIAFPVIDPVLVEFGPFAIRWYALAYVAGLLFGWWAMRRIADRPGSAVTRLHVDDFLVWCTAGVLIGGRLGYALFYSGDLFLNEPWRVLEVWKGGMSFHGGLAGVVIAQIIFARRHNLPLMQLTDLCALVVPVGLLFGRLANFVNGELWGRPTDVPWAMVFPHADDLPRHPSQLYQAGMEGILLLALVWSVWRLAGGDRRPGMVTGAFLAGYGTARIIGELFRQPDAQLGFLAFGATMGQILSLPMVLGGIGLLVWAARRPPIEGVAPGTRRDDTAGA